MLALDCSYSIQTRRDQNGPEYAGDLHCSEFLITGGRIAVCARDLLLNKYGALFAQVLVMIPI